MLWSQHFGSQHLGSQHFGCWGQTTPRIQNNEVYATLCLQAARAALHDPATEEARAQWDEERPLSERLKTLASDRFDPLPGNLLRKYIGYARKYVHPQLTSEAATVLQEFYLNLRQKHRSQDSTPITTRQIESLVRLAEARARLELRETVTRQDAEDVVEIMKTSMIDTCTDDFGVVDYGRSQMGSGMSKKKQAKLLVRRLGEIAEETYNSLFTEQQLRTASNKMGITDNGSVRDLIESLNNQGYLLKKGHKTYQLATSEL